MTLAGEEVEGGGTEVFEGAVQPDGLTALLALHGGGEGEFDRSCDGFDKSCLSV